MKTVNSRIQDMLNKAVSFESSDLYTLVLRTGEVYRFTAYDEDVAIDGKIYRHNSMIFKRDQLKLQGVPAVDSLTITVYCDAEDRVNGKRFMLACHAGAISAGTLLLSRAYFDGGGGECIGAVDVFSGNCEVESAGGLVVQLKVKSVIQGLAAPVPVRMFAAQAAYTNNHGVVTTSSRDTTSMLIPLKPSGKILYRT